MVRALDSRSAGRSWVRFPAAALSGNDLGLFTPMCLCSPSSISWYLARAFMLMRLYVAANGMGPMNKGGIVVIGLAAILIA